MSLPASDPFGVTADPESYMPRAATERALAELERALLAGEFPVVLTGPAGIGKTLLLRVVERRLEGRVRCVYIAYAALSAAELCSWILGLLGESAPANGDSEAALLSAAHRFAEGGTPLALLIDDASAVPADTAERMRALAAGSRGALQIVAADMEDASAEPWVSRFGTHVERVRLEAPMSAAETALYIRARLERGGVSHDHRGRLDAKVIDRIFRRSSGIPRAVQAFASEFLRVGEAALPREALETLLAQEDAVELAARVAANARAREVLPAGRTVQPEGPTPSPVAPALIPRAPERPLVSLVPHPSATTSPSPPTTEPRKQEFPPAASQAGASMPAKPTLETQPRRERASPAAAPPSRPISVAPQVKKRAPAREERTPALHWQVILILSLCFAGAIALAIPFLRSPPTVPEPPAPAIDARSPAPAKTASSEAAGDASTEAPQPPRPKEPDSPLVPQPESKQPVASGSNDPQPSSPSAPLPVAAEVPVAPIPVHINATPWATIEVDGAEVGETPIAGVPLSPGNHVFRARMPDGRVIERTVQIGAGTRHVTFQ